jgi:predicted short-subunit dehydrogenase-like oxidoreductase (DUF2520 family)
MCTCAGFPEESYVRGFQGGMVGNPEDMADHCSATNTMGLWNTLKQMGCLTLHPEWKFLITNIKAPENAKEA